MKITVWHRQNLHELNPTRDDRPANPARQMLYPYLPGDRVTAVYTYERDTGPGLPTTDDLYDLAEQAYRMFNHQPTTPWEQDHTTRYYDARNRSLSIGDVIVFGEIAMACEPDGWAFVALPVQAPR